MHCQESKQIRGIVLLKRSVGVLEDTIDVQQRDQRVGTMWGKGTLWIDEYLRRLLDVMREP